MNLLNKLQTIFFNNAYHKILNINQNNNETIKN